MLGREGGQLRIYESESCTGVGKATSYLTTYISIWVVPDQVHEVDHHCIL